MEYSRNAWQQFAERIRDIPEREWRTDENNHMIKCRKHTDLIMKALKETALDTGYITIAVFLGTACK